jgi:hypothetical protein
VLGLFGIIKRSRGIHTVGYDVDLDDLCEVFPEWIGDRLEAAYSVLTKFVMYTVGDDLNNMGARAPARIMLFHDRTANGKYDPTILRAFNEQLLGPEFEHASYFSTIEPLTWEDCIALQPADLVAFEVFKEAERKVKERQQRKSFKALLDMNAFGIHTKSFTKDILRRLPQRMEKGQNADK